MVLRETGAGWLASMMRAERGPETAERAWLLQQAPDLEVVEAMERWTLPRDAGELPRSG